MEPISKLALITDDIFLGHDTGEEHPESHRRINWIKEGLSKANLFKVLSLEKPRKLAEEVLYNFHTPEYISRLKALADTGGGFWDEDTFVNTDSFHVAKRAVDAVFTALSLVVDGQYEKSLALVRPPGHHASSCRAKGFCLLNNLAVALKELQKKSSLRDSADDQLERIMLIDWDAHHGNGLQEAFYEDNNVLYISIHQDGIFPYTGWTTDNGQGMGEGYNINIPVPRYTGDAGYYYLFQQLILPMAHEFKPQLVVVAAGFDSHFADPMSTLELTAQGYGKITAMLKDIANQYAKGKMVFVLEGGYEEASLVPSLNNVLLTLAGINQMEGDWSSPPPNIMRPQTRERIDDAIRIQKKYWQGI